MPAGQRSHAVRLTALALAGAVNVLFLSLWLLSRAHVPAVAVAAAMVWISAPLPSVLPKASPDQRRRAPVTVRTPAPIVESPAPGQSTAITVPPIDWYAEGIRSARNAFKDEVPISPEPALDSKPQVLMLPDKSNQPHKAGDTEHFEGGEVITWVNERCYYSNRPGPMTFGGASQRVCKTRSMSERRSEARAAELEQAVTPEYLRQPLPEPAPDMEAAHD